VPPVPDSDIGFVHLFVAGGGVGGIAAFAEKLGVLAERVPLFVAPVSVVGIGSD